MTANAIQATGLMFRYRDDSVISGVDLAVKRNESIAVIGPNGSGKSTLLKLLSGILTPERGSVTVEGLPLKSLGRRAVSRRMALVSQEGSGQFPFTVADVVLMGRAPYLSGFQMERAGDHEKARLAMETTDIAGLADRPIGMLSGGERQRAFIARALCQDTPILLLDEPTAFLDIAHQVSLLALIGRLHTRHHKTIVSVTHDINLAASFFSPDRHPRPGPGFCRRAAGRGDHRAHDQTGIRDHGPHRYKPGYFPAAGYAAGRGR